MTASLDVGYQSQEKIMIAKENPLVKGGTAVLEKCVGT